MRSSRKPRFAGGPMVSALVVRFVLAGLILALPFGAYAQEATLSGTVTDATGGVLPGVTVTALHEATGNRFTTVQRTGVELLAGQTVSVDVQLSPSTVQETVTVTAEAPLLNVETSSLGGNVDPRQVQELPVNGRNWMALALLAPGSRTTAVN